MRESWRAVLDPTLGNPYKKFEGEAVNVELITKQMKKEQLDNKKNSKAKKIINPPSYNQIREIIRKDKVMEIFRGVGTGPDKSMFEN